MILPMKVFRTLISLLVTVALLLLIPTTHAFATTDNETKEATPEEIAEAYARGEILTELPEDDSWAGPLMSILSADNKAIKTISGKTLYDTAAAEAKYAYRSTANAIIASGESYVDSLSAVSLAGAMDCPILLTGKTVLNQATADTLSELGVKNIYVIGGKGIISEAVYNELGAGRTIQRISGLTQFDTQLEIYRYGVQKGYWNTGTVFVASGAPNSFADALSASPVAYKEKTPIFLVDEYGALPDQTAAELVANTTITSATIVGGKGVVSQKTEGFLQALTMKNGNVSKVERVSGLTLYDTSAAIARWAVDSGKLSWNNAAVSTAKSPYDALAGSVVQGKESSVLLIADPANTTTLDILATKAVSSFKFFGGAGVYDNTFKAQYALKTGFGLSEIEGFILYLDVGHGWNSSNNGVFDNGAIGNGYTEYELNRELAHKVAALLKSTYNMQVYVNDDGGYYAYRNSEAASMNCGALVSIHFNAAGGSGTESYIHTVNSAQGSDTLQRRVHPKLVAGTGLRDRGMLTMPLAVCSGKVPAVLLEVAFIDNASDMNAYQSRKDTVAEQIAKGIALA